MLPVDSCCSWWRVCVYWKPPWSDPGRGLKKCSDILPSALRRGRKVRIIVICARNGALFLEPTEPSAYRIAGPAREATSRAETGRTDDTGRDALYGIFS